MKTEEVLQIATEDSIQLSIVGDRIKMRPTLKPLSQAFKDGVAANKSELIKILARDHVEHDRVRHDQTAAQPAPPEPVAPAQTYIKHCDVCGGTNWGCVGSDVNGEVWGCLTCHFAHPASCSECGGMNIVKDTLGDYCVDCRKRPGDAPTPPAPEPVYIDVKWAKDETGWLSITNPITGEVAEIRAKGVADKERWLFDRLPKRIHGKSSRARRDDEDPGFVDDPDKPHEQILEDYHFIGDVKMRDHPIMSGKEWPWRAEEEPRVIMPGEESPPPLPILPPVHKQVACPKCKAQRVKHLLTNTMCLACGHKFETDYQP